MTPKEDLMKLSDTQLMILSSASQRADHATVLPANLKGSAANKVVDSLLREKLLEELRATEDMPVWRRGEDNQPYSLRITRTGLNAIEVEDTSQAPEGSALAGAKEIVVADVSTEPKRGARAARANRSSTRKTAAERAKASHGPSARV